MATSVLDRPAPVERVWRAQVRQREFLKADEFAVLYGGAAGGGKSDALLIDAIRTCVRFPGAGVLFLRRNYPDLNRPRAAIPRSHELLSGTGPQWRGDEYTWTFPNKSILQFGHLQHATSVYGYQGAQPDRIEWDELTQFSEEQFWFLTSRVRTVIPGLVPGIRGGTNPGGIGHGWVKRTFIDPAPPNTPFKIRREAETMTARFVPARVQDNEELLKVDPGYVSRLGMLPPELRRAYLDGDWDLFIGQFFGEWRRDVHVCKTFAIPPSWPRWRAVDWGYGAPWCCLWFARSDDRRIYAYRELYEAGVIDSEQARRIVRASEKERIRFTVADPSLWSKQPNGVSIAEIYNLNGVPMLPANNDRRSGWQRVREALRFDDDARPELQVFETCVNLIRTLPEQVHDDIDVEDINTKGEDHAADTLRYGLMPAAAPAQQTTRVRFG